MRLLVKVLALVRFLWAILWPHSSLSSWLGWCRRSREKRRIDMGSHCLVTPRQDRLLPRLWILPGRSWVLRGCEGLRVREVDGGRPFEGLIPLPGPACDALSLGWAAEPGLAQPPGGVLVPMNRLGCVPWGLVLLDRAASSWERERLESVPLQHLFARHASLPAPVAGCRTTWQVPGSLTRCGSS